MGAGPDDRLLTPTQLGEKLSKSRSTLQRQRSLGTGPPYLRVNGSILYRESDVNRWLNKHLKTATEPRVEEREEPTPPEAEEATRQDDRWWEKRRREGGER